VHLVPNSASVRTLRDDRHDWSVRLGLTQILNKDSLIETSLGYTRGTGFLENPYKVVQFLFVDPAQEPFDFGIPGVPPLLTADVRAVLEQRPDTRNQWTWNTRFVQYFTDWDAALHFDYRFFHDDWGINAHTFEAAWGQPVGGGWTITPRVRYYSQDQADFYRPFFLFKQAVPRTPALPPDFSSHIDFSKIPIADFSSDHRLSGYGALSGGLTVSKQFAKGVELEAGFEYYTHQGDLKLGGGGEGDFADFDNFLVNAGLRVDLSAPFLTAGGGPTGHADDGHTGHSGSHAPAGVMFDHMLPKAGDFMVGYRYMYSRQDGDTLRGTDAVSDAAILANACGEPGCSFTSVDMDMHMHMLDIMYAPTDWLNLMLMPQFVDMDMTLRPLEGTAPDLSGGGAPAWRRERWPRHRRRRRHVLFRALQADGRPRPSPAPRSGLERADRRRRREDREWHLASLPHATRQRHLGLPAEPHLHGPPGQAILGHPAEWHQAPGR